jgi:hypothetical protein
MTLHASTLRRPLLRRRRPTTSRNRPQGAFRRWRKTRPFWGGLLTMLGGLEIAILTGMTFSLILVSKSVTFAIANGAVIAVIGLTMWLSPQLNKLLGLLTMVAALVSFVSANLGGFLIGMLLAIVGGGLCFAWEPGLLAEPPFLAEDAEPGTGATAPGEPERADSLSEA